MATANPLFDRPESDQALRNLGNLLKHLNRTLSSEGSKSSYPGLQSPYERRKLRSNFEYARALLLRLEHESVTVKVAARKQTLQVDLKSKRDQVKRIQTRIQQLDERYHDQGVEDDESSEDEEAPVVSEDTKTTSSEAISTQTNDLRSRKGGATKPNDTASYVTGSFQPSKTKPKPREEQTREEILDSDRAQQERIKDALSQMTGELKSSVLLFGDTLEGDKKYVDMAYKGMEKNTDGIESASLRMSTLRKMTEGKGWWARLMLYGYIAGLWFLALVIVFVLPKLRF